MRRGRGAIAVCALALFASCLTLISCSSHASAKALEFDHLTARPGSPIFGRSCFVAKHDGKQYCPRCLEVKKNYFGEEYCNRFMYLDLQGKQASNIESLDAVARQDDYSCADENQKCAGEEGYPYFPYKPCCSSEYQCSENKALGWGRFCVKASSSYGTKCTKDGDRCAGEANKPYVEYAPCCSSSHQCVPVPDKGWGMWCVPGKGSSYTSSSSSDDSYDSRKCTAHGTRCAGAPGYPYVPYAPCCESGDQCVEVQELGWGKFCMGSSAPHSDSSRSPEKNSPPKKYDAPSEEPDQYEPPSNPSPSYPRTPSVPDQYESPPKSNPKYKPAPTKPTTAPEKYQPPRGDSYERSPPYEPDYDSSEDPYERPPPYEPESEYSDSPPYRPEPRDPGYGSQDQYEDQYPGRNPPWQRPCYGYECEEEDNSHSTSSPSTRRPTSTVTRSTSPGSRTPTTTQASPSTPISTVAVTEPMTNTAPVTQPRTEFGCPSPGSPRPVIESAFSPSSFAVLAVRIRITTCGATSETLTRADASAVRNAVCSSLSISGDRCRLVSLEEGSAIVTIQVQISPESVAFAQSRLSFVFESCDFQRFVSADSCGSLTQTITLEIPAGTTAPPTATVTDTRPSITSTSPISSSASVTGTTTDSPPRSTSTATEPRTTQTPPSTTSRTTTTTTTTSRTTAPANRNSCATGTRVRKECMDMSSAEWDRYQRAVRGLQELPGSSGGLSRFEEFTVIHDRERARGHGGVYFLPWHRDFIFEYESALQEIDPSVTLCYWDWSIDFDQPGLSSIWNLFGGGQAGSCIPSAPFQNWRVNYPDPHCVVRGFTYGASRGPDALGINGDWQSRSNYDVLFSENHPYSFIAGMIESTHGVPHVDIGGANGDMRFTPIASNDPIFYAHHTFVDKLWNEWQRRGNGNEFNGNHPANGPSASLSTTMRTRTVSQVFSELTCVQYQESSRRRSARMLTMTDRESLARQADSGSESTDSPPSTATQPATEASRTSAREPSAADEESESRGTSPVRTTEAVTRAVPTTVMERRTTSGEDEAEAVTTAAARTSAVATDAVITSSTLATTTNSTSGRCEDDAYKVAVENVKGGKEKLYAACKEIALRSDAECTTYTEKYAALCERTQGVATADSENGC